MPSEAEARQGRDLASYVAELVGRLAAAEPSSAARLLQVVGPHRARIALDGEAVVVAVVAGRLVVEPARDDHEVDGEGSTTRAAVLDLLRGELEATDALLRGEIEVVGSADAVPRILHAIEILLDASARVPALRDLAAELHASAHASGARPGTAGSPPPAGDREAEVLARLDLLP